jgi:hypothetical protein
MVQGGWSHPVRPVFVAIAADLRLTPSHQQGGGHPIAANVVYRVPPRACQPDAARLARCAQEGQRANRGARAEMRRWRIVAIEFGR